MNTETLDFGDAADAQQMLQDLSQVRDFPALSHIISQVTRIATAEDSHVDELTDSILKDVSLTNKLLRIVNSVNYGQFGNNAINTVSRAIVILGYDTVRDAALSLMLFEHLNNHAQARELKGEALEGLFCGLIGRSLASRAGMREGEEVLICAMFRNLGRMMCRLHFYDKSKEVERLTREEGLTEEVASRRVFGLSYDAFGQTLGRFWHLPNSLLQGMAELPAGPVKAASGEHGRLQVLANMAHDFYVVSRDAPNARLHDALADLGKRYAGAVNILPEALVEVLYEAGEAMEKEARLLQVDVKTSPLLSRLLGGPGQRATPAPAEETSGELPPEPVASSDPTGILVTGLGDLTSMLLEEAPMANVLKVAAEILYRATCFDNVIICSLAPGGKELVPRVGYGRQAERLKKALRIPLAFAPDVFHAALSKHVDVLIADTTADNIRTRIPAWYAEGVAAKSFLLLPIVVGNHPVAMIYGDRRATTLQLSPHSLGLVKTMRNQIALALRQKGPKT